MMLTRRTLITSAAASSLLWPPAGAQSILASANLEELGDPPLEDGYADFSRAWSVQTPQEGQLFGVPLDIPVGIAEAYGKIVFRNHDDIATYFQDKVNNNFIDWFNVTAASLDEWKGKGITAPGAQKNFKIFWDQYLSTREITLMEFIAYMSIFVNECGGNLVSKSELFGMKGYPGVCYLFDTIIKQYPDGHKWSKRSYNTGSANLTAHHLFNDRLFNEAHGGKALAASLKNTADMGWAKDSYPRAIPYNAKASDMGYVMETDFFKFRGRGLIQTTWRANYRGLAKFIQTGSATSSVVAQYRARWKGLTSEQICTVSSNYDWDTLFGDPDRVILCESVRQHAAAGRYADLEKTSAGINGGVGKPGSIACMGLRISGGSAYAGTFKSRVSQLCSALAKI
jgi:hypothetical protein